MKPKFGYTKFFATAALACAPAAFGQINPDPDIFDANANGVSASAAQARNQGRNMPQVNVGGTPLGGMISVVDESKLPPIGQIPIDVNSGRRQGQRTPSGNMPQSGGRQGSSGSSGMPIPMGGGSQGQGGQSSSSPFPMPQGSQSQGGQQGQQSSPFPMPQGSQSQGGMQGQQSSGMPQGSQSQGGRTPSQNKSLIPMPPSNRDLSQLGQQGGQQGQSGQSGQQSGQQGQQGGQQGEMSEAGQQGQGGQGNMSELPPGVQPAGEMPPVAQLPPPPPDIPIGDPSQEIGGSQGPIPEGAEASEEGGGGGEGEPSNRNSKSRQGVAGAQGGKQVTETDGQEMPDGIGGSQGSNRGRGTEEGAKMSTEL